MAGPAPATEIIDICLYCGKKSDYTPCHECQKREMDLFLYRNDVPLAVDRAIPFEQVQKLPKRRIRTEKGRKN